MFWFPTLLLVRTKELLWHHDNDNQMKKIENTQESSGVEKQLTLEEAQLKNKQKYKIIQ